MYMYSKKERKTIEKGKSCIGFYKHRERYKRINPKPCNTDYPNRGGWSWEGDFLTLFFFFFFFFDLWVIYKLQLTQ